ncbi:hypothetical protein PENSPDRAFT_658851 [Peniophora sp. CONT]|nr:hypothetical protein PENSPDRAFT_658851 [Peniophora sp. CONT]
MSEDENALYEGEPPGGLTVWEALVWRMAYAQLLFRGYRLRDRYRPDWKPSWIDKGLDIATVREQHLEGTFEDCIPQHRYHHAIDAVHISSSQQVMLKLRVSESEQHGELIINRRLASVPLASNPQNHCLQIIDEPYFEH